MMQNIHDPHSVFSELIDLSRESIKGRPEVSAIQKDLSVLSEKERDFVPNHLKEQLCSDVYNRLISLVRLMPVDNSFVQIVWPGERNPVTHIGNVFSLQISRSYRRLCVSLIEHDKAFIFDTAFGVTANREIASAIDKLPYDPEYLCQFPFRKLFPQPRAGDALLEFYLELNCRGFFSTRYDYLKDCYMKADANLLSGLGCHSYLADMKKGTTSIHSSDGSFRRDSYGYVGYLDLRFITSHFNRLADEADNLAAYYDEKNTCLTKHTLRNSRTEL